MTETTTFGFALKSPRCCCVGWASVLEFAGDGEEHNVAKQVVLGAGQVGLRLAKLLADQGDEVVLVRRGPASVEIPGVRWLRGDVTDVAFAAQAGEGAEVVYHCMNPAAYHRWGELLPPLYEGAMTAAQAGSGRLVVLDNLYMYGAPEGALREDTPMRPCSKKGELRARLAERLLEADAKGRLQVALGRASDFFGPGAASAAVFHPRFLERLRSGKAVEVFGDPEMPHSYSFIPDVAKGLALLGGDSTARGVWHLPVSAQLSTQELVQVFAQQAGVPTKLRRIPTALLQGLGWFVPLVAAVAEMAYQWEMPFLVDDSAFRRRYRVPATPVERAVASTLAASCSGARPAAEQCAY